MGHLVEKSLSVLKALRTGRQLLRRVPTLEWPPCPKISYNTVKWQGAARDNQVGILKRKHIGATGENWLEMPADHRHFVAGVKTTRSVWL